MERGGRGFNFRNDRHHSVRLDRRTREDAMCKVLAGRLHLSDSDKNKPLFCACVARRGAPHKEGTEGGSFRPLYSLYLSSHVRKTAVKERDSKSSR